MSTVDKEQEKKMLEINRKIEMAMQLLLEVSHTTKTQPASVYPPTGPKGKKKRRYTENYTAQDSIQFRLKHRMKALKQSTHSI